MHHGFPVILAQRGVCVHRCVAAEASSWRTASAPPGPLVEWVRLASSAVATGRKEFEGQTRYRSASCLVGDSVLCRLRADAV